MKRIATPNRDVDKFGPGKDGFRAAVAGVSSATEFSAPWFNHMQESIVRVIEQAGLALSDTDFDQFVLGLNSTYARLGAPSQFTVSPALPMPAQFDATAKAASMAAVQRALGSFSGTVGLTAAGVALNATHVGQFLSLTANIAQQVSLPALGDVVPGSMITLHNPGAGLKTVTIQGTDQISPDGNAYTSINLPAGTTISFVADATIWRAYGEGALKYATSFGSTLASPGAQKFPSGLILQMGSISTNSSGDGTVVFSTPFPTAFLATSFTYQAIARNYPNSMNFYNPTRFGFSAYGFQTTNGAAAAIAAQYIALGY